MHWNEKIELIKKAYPVDEFSVPHTGRKNVLRNIETRFIGRPEDYYELNNSNERFSNWWDNIKSTHEGSMVYNSDLKSLLSSFIESNQSYWIACEFSSGILIYKGRKSAILDLMSIGRTWTNTFHLIQVKYDYLISFKIEDAEIRIKTSGNSELEQTIRAH